jgi:hypothetical protein
VRRLLSYKCSLQWPQAMGVFMATNPQVEMTRLTARIDVQALAAFDAASFKHELPTPIWWGERLYS